MAATAFPSAIPSLAAIEAARAAVEEIQGSSSSSSDSESSPNSQADDSDQELTVNALGGTAEERQMTLSAHLQDFLEANPYVVREALRHSFQKYGRGCLIVSFDPPDIEQMNKLLSRGLFPARYMKESDFSSSELLEADLTVQNLVAEYNPATEGLIVAARTVFEEETGQIGVLTSIGRFEFEDLSWTSCLCWVKAGSPEEQEEK